MMLMVMKRARVHHEMVVARMMKMNMMMIQLMMVMVTRVCLSEKKNFDFQTVFSF
jgi:hypothetical protein